MNFFYKNYLYYIILIPIIFFSKQTFSEIETKLSTINTIKNEKFIDNYLPKYFLGPGDVLSIKVYKFDSFDSMVTIMPDGNINLPRIKPILLNGLTIDRANFLITNEYNKILKNPIIYVDLIKARPIRVSISGQVQRPGIYSLNINEKNEVSNTDGGESIIVESKGWPSVIELIQKAGGLSTDGDLRTIKLKRFNRDKNKIDEISINFWEALTGGGLIKNYPIFDGDSIHVLKNIELPQNERSEISKSNLAPSTISVTVIGEVRNPGTTTIRANSPIQNAVLNAGGFTAKANQKKISLLRLLDNGKIVKKTFNTKNKNLINEIFLRDRDVVFIDNNLISKTSINLKSFTEPISPLINAATIYKIFFGD